jgi:two-component system, NarL family, nitrate/nitrite response regulator NarL
VEPLIRVVIADDHPPTREGVRLSLEEDGFEVIGQAANGPQLVEQAVALQPDVCVVDVNMPGGGGVVAVQQLMSRLPDMTCVMLTASRNDDDLFAALRAGAIGYLLKDIDPDRLGEALRGALRGEAPLPPALVTRLVREFRTKQTRRIVLPDRTVELTERELEVLEGLRAGKRTKELAEELGVAQVTVRSYVHTLLKKLRVPDREAAVRLVEGQPL